MVKDIKDLRVMWLLNHTTARKFEIPMLKKLGITQIFTPKVLLIDLTFRTASVDYAEDATLDIPAEDLDVLNSINWYSNVPVSAWDIVNKYFDVAFMLPMGQEVLESFVKYFKGIVLWRAYGRDSTMSYDTALNNYITKEGQGGFLFRQLGKRFFFGEAYSHIADTEPLYLSSRRLYLPLGLPKIDKQESWEGKSKNIYFVCPEISISQYYSDVYTQFKEVFRGLPYIIAGAQPIPVINDSAVLGYVSDDQHIYNMTQCRVMFYHSREPNHIHFHPFEAIRFGMPLVFMADGMLDRLGGINLPGRAKTLKEARHKVERILAGDKNLIKNIKATQSVLLDAMNPINCEPAWKEGFNKIVATLVQIKESEKKRPNRKKNKRIAIILPDLCLRVNLRTALTMALNLQLGSRQKEEEVEIVVLYQGDNDFDVSKLVSDWPASIKLRRYSWKVFNRGESRRAMRYAGYNGWEPTREAYITPDDGIQQLLDCDLWLIVGNRLSYPLLPIKPVALLIYGFDQVYTSNDFESSTNPSYLLARSVNRIFVSTDFMFQNTLQYAGVENKKISKLPLLMPTLPQNIELVHSSTVVRPYFLWVINLKTYKSYENVARALKIYYEELGGVLDCHIIEEGQTERLESNLSDKQTAALLLQETKLMRKRVKRLCNMDDVHYYSQLKGTQFLCYTGHLNHEAFSVPEAFLYGVPTLCSDYPDIREMNNSLGLQIDWMKCDDPRDMAEQLKQMQFDADLRRGELYKDAQSLIQANETRAAIYWQEVAQCL